MQTKKLAPKQLALCAVFLAVVVLVVGVHFFLPGFFQIGYSPTNPEPIQQQEMLRMNLNTATAQQLQLLDGLGEKTAEAILDYRSEHGAFSAIDELKNIKGISDKKVENWAPYIYIE